MGCGENSQMSEAFGLVDIWLLNNRVNLKLLDALNDEQLAYTANPRARNIAHQIAHLHNVRRMWLGVSAPSAAKSLDKLEKGDFSKPTLARALTASAQAMAGCIEEAEKKGKLRGYKRGPAAFLAYALAHEAHHRGQVILHLKYAKIPVDRMLGYSLWEWEKW